MADRIDVEVVYALPDKAFVRELRLDAGVTVQAAIDASGVLDKYPEIDLAKQKVGIFSRTVKLEQILAEGDRVEIYRPLLADPREVRRKRAEQAKAEGRADKVTGGKLNPQRKD